MRLKMIRVFVAFIVVSCAYVYHKTVDPKKPRAEHECKWIKRG